MEGLDFEGERESDILITIDGKSGAGKGTVAGFLADKLDIEYYSAGDFFRQIADEKGLTVEELSEKADREVDVEVDRRTFEQGLSESCVIESRIASHVLKDYSDLKIRLKADLEERAKRVAEREALEAGEARESIRKRDEDNRKRYQHYYGIDMEDLSIYDIVVDNSELNIEETNKLIEKALEMWFEPKGLNY
jgi:cytidylate kinase